MMIAMVLQGSMWAAFPPGRVLVIWRTSSADMGGIESTLDVFVEPYLLPVHHLDFAVFQCIV